MNLSDRKEKRLAKKQFLKMLQEYNQKKEELQQMYMELIRKRELAGMDDEIERPEFYEVPEYIPGQTITIRR